MDATKASFFLFSLSLSSGEESEIYERRGGRKGEGEGKENKR